MNTLSNPLEISAASIRLAGYVIETNLRMAQIFGQAVLTVNPLASTMRARSAGSKPTQAKTPVTKRVKAEPVQKSAEVKSTPRSVKKAELAKPSAKVVARKPAKAVAKKTRSAAKPVAKTMPIDADKSTVKTPEFKSRSTRVTPKPAAKQKIAPNVVKSVSVAAPQTPKPQEAETKRHLAPSTPPALPVRGQDKDQG